MTGASPRVALVAGGLGKGGAEKQLVYMARALIEAGVTLRVYSLTRGEYYEAPLRAMGIPVIWAGRAGHPAARVLFLTRALREFRPHVIHATHFFANLYPVILAPLTGAMAIGSLRNDVTHEIEANGVWGRWLLRLPGGLVANSQAARRNAEAIGGCGSRTVVVPNVIEVERVGPWGEARDTRAGDATVVIAVARLAPAKRLDLFLQAVARARREVPTLRAVLVGEGPERPRLEREAERLGLLPGGLTLTGHLDDVRPALARADLLLLTSDHEGFPNVLLEAMAAALPIITTPAGDAGSVVENEVTGYVVPHGAVEAMAGRIVELARAPALRARLGAAGHAKLIRCYGTEGLGERLLRAYATLARRQEHRAAAEVLRPWRDPSA